MKEVTDEGIQTWVCIVNECPFDNLNEVLHDQNFSDVTVSCEDGVLRAHRIVLASSSQFLKQIFLEVGGRQSTIVMPGIEIGVMSKLLELMYTGSISASWSDVPQAIVISQMLQLEVDLSYLQSLASIPELSASIHPDEEGEDIKIIIAGDETKDLANLSAWFSNSELLTADDQERDQEEMVMGEVVAMEVAPEEEQRDEEVVEGGYHCDVCNRLVTSKIALEGHMRVHNGDKPYNCRFCERRFTFKSNWKQHEGIHLAGGIPKVPLRKFTCETCGKRFRCWSALMTHKRTHTGDRPFNCMICSRGFATRSNCKKHELLHQTGRIDQPRDGDYSCHICTKLFKTKTYLQVHLRMHLNVKPYTCQYCGKGFNFTSNLTAHEKAHHGKVSTVIKKGGRPIKMEGESELLDETEEMRKIRKFHCEICGKWFYSNSNLLGHKRVHMEVKQYSCQICFKTFTYNSNCRKHEQLHSKWEEKESTLPKQLMDRVQCDICFKEFSPSHLRVHKRLHSGERPYQCRYCMRAFTFSSNCAKHEKLHEQGRRVGREHEITISVAS